MAGFVGIRSMAERRCPMTSENAMIEPSFAINHILAPSLRQDAFFELCRRVGASGAEIRNDLDGNAILDGTPAEEVKAAAEAAGIRILTINSLQPGGSDARRSGRAAVYQHCICSIQPLNESHMSAFRGEVVRLPENPISSVPKTGDVVVG
ncbi:hypothetical protein [Bradyrhizobium barranii]|uniref:hypothetical protein n=1 Tax=Bradyrhizobium barranii TaxID=2992140 RepID=UPI00140C7AB0|nr:hypothetical protein [Bradyrhizobium barranii]